MLVVVPARGGSKSIPLKNLAEVQGRSLIEIVGSVIRKIDWIDRAVVSTDHPKIKEVALQSGLSVPFMRPESISGDFVSDTMVLQHALAEIERIDDQQYSLIVMLQPTSPFRRVEHIVGAIEFLMQGNFDSVVSLSVTDTKFHPLKQLDVRNDLVTFHHNMGSKIIARQQLTPTYHRNGTVYVITRECLTTGETIIGTNCGGYVIDEPQVNIDTYADLDYAEYLLQN